MLNDAAAAWLAEGRAAVVVTVSEASGSVPRDAGTRMLVSMHTCIGTIGGGHLELQAIATARDMLQRGELQPHEQRQALGPALGQCCGGVVVLRFERLRPEAVTGWARPPRFHLQLYGAGHVGRAIARLLVPLAVTVDWIDEREDEFPQAVDGQPWPRHIRHLAVDAVEAEVARAPAGAYYLVLTHRHDLDERIAEAILRRGDFGYFGLIGSLTKRARFRHRFEQHGLAASVIDRMICPIGVPGITGKEPEVIAIGVVAQLLQQPPAD
jgi:xanthine dehydrogenase accessory factor